MKQILAILMLLTLLSSVASALDFTRDGTTSSPSGSSGGGGGGSSSIYSRPYPLVAGWNVLPFGNGIEFIGGDLEDNLKAAYVWNPMDNKYVDVLIGGEQALRDLTEQFGYTGVWVYLKTNVDNFRMEVDNNEVDQVLAQTSFTFPQGWNFYVILPHMLKAGYNGNFLNMGKEFMRAEKVYAWSKTSWESGLFSSVQNQTDVVGIPFLVYYTAPFTPFMDKSVAPPAFPVENVR